jgi:putative ABC transport system permease protein
VGLVGLLLWPRSAPRPGLLGSLLVYGLLLVATLLSPFVLPFLARAVGVPFAILLRAEERLARGALAREPSRTALTVGSLTIGLAMIVALAAVGQSDRQAATAWLTDVVPGDEIATSIRPVGLDEGIQVDLAAVRGVERVSPIGRFDLAYQGVRLDGAAVSGADFLADGRLTFVNGERRVALADLDDGGTVIVPATQANRLGLRIGDRMTFTRSDGMEAQLRIAGVVARSLPGRSGEALLISWQDATSQFGVLGADAFAIRFAPGAAAQARPLVEDQARALALEPNAIEAVQGAVGETLARVFGLFDALAAIAVVVAGLGIINTLTMNVMERVREIGVLRAVGMTRRQVWRMVVVEAGIVGVMGAILGCLTGVAAGLVMIAVAGGLRESADIEIPWLILGVAATFGVGVAILAAAYPARLASRMSIVRAVQYE